MDSFRLRLEAANGSNYIGDEIIQIDNIELVADAVLNVNDLEDQVNLKLYPNPVDSREYLKIKSTGKISTLEIFDMLGRKEIFSSENVIDTSKLASGVYITKITLENNMILNRKFLKR